MPKRNRAYTKQDIVNAIDAINNKEMAILEACRTFHIPRSTLQDHIDKNHPNGIGRPSAVDVFVEKRLAIFLTYLTKWKCNLTRDSFCKFSAEVIAETGTQCPRFKDNIPGEHWVRNFVKRHKIEFKFGFTPRSSLFHLIEYYDHLQESLDGVPIQNIFTNDEVFLLDVPDQKRCLLPRRCLKKRNFLKLEQDQTKKSFSVMFCGSSVGELLPPMVVYNNNELKEEWTHGGTRGTLYDANCNGCFARDNFCRWFFELFVEHCKGRSGPFAIVGYNLGRLFSEKVVLYCQAYDIRIVSSLPNETKLCQPLDLAIYKDVKKEWYDILTDWRTIHPELISNTEFPSKLKEIIRRVDPSNLEKSFRACGIVPLDKHQIVNGIPKIETLDNGCDND